MSQRQRWFASLLLFTVFVASGVFAASPPNIVLIISDDQHYGDYGFMGHPAVETPHIDKLAAEGVVFRRGYVPSSLCCPSLASIITGLYPHQSGITSNDPPAPPNMPRGQFYNSEAFRSGREVMASQMRAAPTLPRRLQEQGYISLQTGKWWQGEFANGGFTHGMSRGGRHGDDGLDIGRKTMQPIKDFLDIAAREQKPFFIWYAPMLPHDPHDPAPELVAKYAPHTKSIHQARYWGNVERFDATCGELLAELDRRNLAENTIVVYVADNGWIQDADSPRYAPRSKQSPNESGLRTPIIIRWRGHLTPRDDATLLVSSLDIAPTLLAATGLAPSTALTGINLLDDNACRARRENGNQIYGECYTHDSVDLNEPEKNLRYLWTIASPWKLVLARENETSPPQLYNLDTDPNEEHNLAAEEPERTATMTADLERHWQSRQKPIAPQNMP
ncbi:MAG: sulfatase family protein [Thermoguttaceae bacterium]